MKCQSTRVPMTPRSTGQCRSHPRREPGPRGPLPSRIASAAIEAMTHSTPATMTASLSGVGLVMKRVSTVMRADRAEPHVAGPGVGSLRSVKIPVTWGFLSGGSVPVAPGMPTNSAPAPPGLAQTLIVLHVPEATAARGATAATVSRKATTTESLLARTNSPLREASIPSAGLVENATPPPGGRVAMARQGIDASRASGAPETSGAVRFPTVPPGPGACGQRMVAVVWVTGSSGVSAHRTIPARPARTATRRAIPEDPAGSGPSSAIRLESLLTLGTMVDGRRRDHRVR